MEPDIIWMGNEASVVIFADDGFGNKIGNAIFEYCFFQDFVITAVLPMAREAVTGRENLKLVTQAYEYECSVEHWFARKAVSFNMADVFNRTKRLIIEMSMQHHGETPETHTLKMAFAGGFSIKAEDNKQATGSAKFSAEMYE